MHALHSAFAWVSLPKTGAANTMAGRMHALHSAFAWVSLPKTGAASTMTGKLHVLHSAFAWVSLTKTGTQNACALQTQLRALAMRCACVCA